MRRRRERAAAAGETSRSELVPRCILCNMTDMFIGSAYTSPINLPADTRRGDTSLTTATRVWGRDDTPSIVGLYFISEARHVALGSGSLLISLFWGHVRSCHDGVKMLRLDDLGGLLWPMQRGMERAVLLRTSATAPTRLSLTCLLFSPFDEAEDIILYELRSIINAIMQTGEFALSQRATSVNAHGVGIFRTYCCLGKPQRLHCLPYHRTCSMTRSRLRVSGRLAYTADLLGSTVLTRCEMRAAAFSNLVPQVADNATST
jgi:hypothetical protein